MSVAACIALTACSGAAPHPAATPPVLPAVFGGGTFSASAARGRALMIDTRDSLPAFDGSALRCTSCHLDEGRRPNAIPWIGVTARFPQYRSRSGTVQTLEQRVNGCFQRSLNGKALAVDSREMRDIVTYMAALSVGVRVGDSVAGQGVERLPLRKVDAAHGARIFAQVCSHCHGADGHGTPLAPAVWGDQSYNIGAGMARLTMAAAFIRRNMPYDQPGTLSEQEAFDVAAYINGQPRPDFAGKTNDWPNGDAPADAAYPTRAGRKG